jgi:hypothetical protein
VGRDRGRRADCRLVALAPGDAPGALDLNKLFIEPRHIRSGVGRALLAHAIAEARRRGAGRLTILADPNAAERAGAMRIGEAPWTRCPAACCRSTRSGSIPRVIVISSLIWAADPSATRPSAVRASFGEPADPSVGEAHLSAAPLVGHGRGLLCQAGPGPGTPRPPESGTTGRR